MSKKSLNNPNMRKAYYEASDKIPELKKQAKAIGDEELEKVALEIEAKLKEYHEILETKNWPNKLCKKRYLSI